MNSGFTHGHVRYHHEIVSKLPNELGNPEYGKHILLSGYRGSQAHGTFIEPNEKHGTDDVDIFGIFSYDLSYYLGLPSFLGQGLTITTAGEDLDIEAHELRKFIWLLTKGNPNVHSYLWLDPQDYFEISPAGRILLRHREEFLSKKVFSALSGYAFGQIEQMHKFEKKGYMGDKREKIVKEYGYDIKNAAHCLRLLHMGICLAKEGRIIVKLDGEIKTEIMRTKTGHMTYEQVRKRAEELFYELKSFTPSVDLPDIVKTDTANTLIIDLIHEIETQEIYDR